MEKLLIVDDQQVAKKIRARYPGVKMLALSMLDVRQIGGGLSTRQIAERLFISKRTVETHRKNIYKKLGIHNNIELIQYARRKKWL